MTEKEIVAQVPNRSPENATLDEITEETQILAAIRQGREDIAAGRKQSHQEVETLLASWTRREPMH